jgi:hypothetical protein
MTDIDLFGVDFRLIRNFSAMTLAIDFHIERLLRGKFGNRRRTYISDFCGPPRTKKQVCPSGIPSFLDALNNTEDLFKDLMLEKHLTEALDQGFYIFLVYPRQPVIVRNRGRRPFFALVRVPFSPSSGV